MRRRGVFMLAVLLLACTGGCGAEGGGSAAPLDPEPGVRASSFRACGDGCDYGEACDYVSVGCSQDTGICRPQPGDVLCHRVCEEDGTCASGETCVGRPTIEFDERTLGLCVCEGATCPSYPAREAEGGLSALRSETSLPIDLFDHALAIGGRRVVVSGGSTANPDDPATGSILNRAIFAARIGVHGRLDAWHEVGTLPEPIAHHAMAVVGRRLYVVGGGPNPASSTGLATDVWSARFDGTGRLGPFRAERPLPAPRGWATALVVDRRLIVLGGDYYSTPDVHGAVWTTDVADDGTLAPFRSVYAPDELHDDGGAVLGHDRLYVVAADGALYSLAFSALFGPQPPSPFVERDGGLWREEGRVPIWHGHPSGTRWAPLQTIAGAVLDDALVYVVNSGVVATAPLDADGRVGVFRAATRPPVWLSSFAAVPNGDARVYVTGGLVAWDGVVRRREVFSFTRE